MPSLAKLALISGERTPALMGGVELLDHDGGVPAGATTPNSVS